MTLDEAIKHAEEIAAEKESEAQALEYSKLDWKYEADKCSECAKEHRQLAEWLKELKQLREQTRWTPVSAGLPEDSDEYFVSVIDEDVETYRHTGIAWYAHPKDYDVEEGDWRELMIDEKVIAWKPLPKPYDPQEEGDKE